MLLLAAGSWACTQAMEPLSDAEASEGAAVSSGAPDGGLATTTGVVTGDSTASVSGSTNSTSTGTGAPAPDAPEGALIDGTCFAWCSGPETDPDGDGWGWESGESCVVRGTATAARAGTCATMSDPFVPPPPGEAEKPEEVLSTGFFVLDGRLYDRFGNDFVMRGINYPHFWFLDQFQIGLPAIQSTGANAVRLVWETGSYGAYTDEELLGLLRAGIQRSVELEMVPMVELHDVTGGNDNDDLLEMADYYGRPEVLAILTEFEEHLLVNIANEWAGFDWLGGYRAAIQQMRAAGINHTLVIDANGWGQTYQTVLDDGAALLEADPQHNLLFSVHMYEFFRDPVDVRAALGGAEERGLPLIVGEFGFQHGDPVVPVAFETILSEAERLRLGYLAWSWTGNSGGVEYLDLSSGFAAELTTWGQDVVEGPNGIRLTSERSLTFGL